MEGKRNTTRVRIRAWTPASGYSSPPSPVSSQLSWDEGRDEDFQNQMDENGIIGLRETQEETSEQEDEVVLEEEEDMLSDVDTPEPEDGPSPVLEDLSYHLSELLDSEPIGDDSLSPRHNNVECSVSLEDWSDDDDDIDNEEKLDEEDEEIFNIRRPIFPHSRKDRDFISGIPHEETEVGGLTMVKLHGDESDPLEMNIVPRDNWTDSCDITSHEGMNNTNKSEIADLGTRTPSQNSCDERSHASSSPSFRNAPQSHIHPHIPKLTLHDEASNHGIADETYAKLPGTYSLRLRHSPRTYPPVRAVEEEKEPVPAPRSFNSENGLPAGPQERHHQDPISTLQQIDSTPQMDHSSSNSSAKPTAKDFTSGHRIHHRPPKISQTDLKDVRNGQLSHPLPDFSKVEPRVRFPKSRYTPPKSRKPPHKENSKLEAPVLFKSPADIVREALLSNSEGPSDSVASTHSQKPLKTTTPEQFRCPLQASAMVQQLQEDYNRLLTKYAEAENTIDRLRLEAKVCLHSDPPKPSQHVLSGVLREGSKVISLSFPQAQRAELGIDAVQPTQQRLSSATRATPNRPSSVESFTSSWRESPTAPPLTEALSNQMARFQIQINEFEKLLKSRRLQPSEQAQGLSQLTQGQESMEKAYLAAREKHQQVQRQTGGKSQTFDPDRELESLIFQAGIQLEELKEWIEETEHVQLTEATPSNPTHALQPFVSLNETEPQPENPACAAHEEVIVGVEVSSVSGESDGEKEEGEEDMLPSVLHPLKHKHRRVEKDFSKLMDNYQDFRDFSKLLDGDQAQVDHNSLELRDLSPHPARIARIESKQQQRSENKRHADKPLPSVPVADSLSGPSASSHVCKSMETLPEASVPASELPRKQGSRRSATDSIKSHSSQGKSAAMGKGVSKENDRALRTQLQDGVVTPETDSGFLGSESSRLTPAAQSPVQRRAALRATRPSVTQEKCRINPDSSASTHTQPSSDASRAHVIASGDAPGSLGRRGGARMHHNPSSSASSSPLRWPSTPLQPWPSSVISELEQQSECAHSLSEDGIRQDDQQTQPTNQDPLYLRSSSFTAPYHHGDHLNAQSSGQLVNHHEAIESLQAEVHRLREHLEGTLRTAGPLHRLRATHSPSKDIRDHTLPHTSTPHPQQRDFRERTTASTRDPRETVKIEHEKTIPRRRSASVPRLRPEPDTGTDSDHTQFKAMTPEHIPASPVMIQTTRRARAETRRSPKTTSNRQKHSLSADRSFVRNTGAEPGGRPVPLCSSCMARRNRTSGCQARNVSSPSHTRYYSDHCPLCGATKTANQSSVAKELRPVRSTRMQTGGVYLAVAPPPPPVIGSVPLLQCMQVCPSVLYYSSPVVSASYQKPLYISQSEGKGYKGHHMRSHSVDAQRALNRSLGRAIAAVGSVREMSERMVSSLSSGLHHMSPLAKSCTY
ncbi:microtubule organization protein AKNA [Tachysurus fulvidraco]|uniref:microtubule organization protein AKNA n=1 Tax=Tachysurus fulvidraco TaxID=1234273 RepID=UPI001FED8E9E|nr:microtubule organization protein AKNA [Tachysurus fulvidraco]